MRELSEMDSGGKNTHFKVIHKMPLQHFSKAAAVFFKTCSILCPKHAAAKPNLCSIHQPTILHEKHKALTYSNIVNSLYSHTSPESLIMRFSAHHRISKRKQNGNLCNKTLTHTCVHIRFAIPFFDNFMQNNRAMSTRFEYFLYICNIFRTATKHEKKSYPFIMCRNIF